MSAGEAPGEIIIATGSPGTTRSSTKMMIATPTRVIAAMARRWGAPDITRRRRTGSVLPGERALPVLSRSRHQSRLQGAGSVWRYPQRGLIDDRLEILHKRDHITLLVNI